MDVCCECCVLSCRGLCYGLITRPEEFYRLWRVVVCDHETSNTRRLKPVTGLWKIQPQWVVMQGKQTNKLSGKVIQMNQVDATMIYWSIKSAQHVSGNIFPIFRSVRLRFLQHMLSCCCGGRGDGERQRGTLLLTVSLPTTTTG